MKKLKKCLDCSIDISNTHYNRKRCSDCAKKIALFQGRESVKKWKAANPDKVKALYSSWNHRFPLKKRLTHAKDIAKRRGHECKITNDEFIAYWNVPCCYCSTSIKDNTGIGLDRLDNNKGYIKENVVPCCGSCNQIRNNHLTHDEMKAAMTAVLDLRKSRGEHV